MCCSGSTDDYCGTGCVLGCDPIAAEQSSTSDIARQEAQTSGEPILGAARTTTAGAGAATGSVTTDGTCGRHNDGTLCGDWPRNRLCSLGRTSNCYCSDRRYHQLSTRRASISLSVHSPRS